jgi:hypothetical protein
VGRELWSLKMQIQEAEVFDGTEISVPEQVRGFGVP